MADTNLPSTPADGNILTVLVPTVADLDSPTLTEVTAPTAEDISCYLTAGGFALTVDQATITDERECDTIVRNAPGRKTVTLSITGIDNTNTSYAATDNALVDALTEGSKWVAIRRRGLPHTTALTAGDIVSVTSFTVGVRSEVPAEANSVLRSVWNCFVDGHEPNAEIVAP